MGGLHKYMPVTHITFLIACFAIAGIPPFSGFFSKDEILTACFQFNPAMGWIMTAIAAMTAFYMFRLYYGIFWGKENKELHSEHKPHESPLAMNLPKGMKPATMVTTARNINGIVIASGLSWGLCAE